MGILLLLILIIVIFSLYKPVIRAKCKGAQGERQVRNKLAGKLSNEYYKVLNDVVLKTERGTTQIDHVVVSIYGIFVVETKNYTGWITGSENSEKWTKNMYGKKYQFYNPIKQNYAHEAALKELLGIHKEDIIPIVVFSDKCNLKVNTNKNVITYKSLINTILGYTEIRFSLDQVNNMINVITNSNIEDKDVMKNHVDQIHKNVDINNMKVKSGICPKCGGTLVQRKGKYGAFLGCSNFPKCRYIKK